MELTVGLLEEKLRNFPKGTPIHVSCGCCHHGSLGDEKILAIRDDTDQTYGYIELCFNDSVQSNVELSTDKEQFYKAEIEKLNRIISKQNRKLEIYKEHIQSEVRSSEGTLRYADKI